MSYLCSLSDRLGVGGVEYKFIQCLAHIAIITNGIPAISCDRNDTVVDRCMYMYSTTPQNRELYGFVMKYSGGKVWFNTKVCDNRQISFVVSSKHACYPWSRIRVILESVNLDSAWTSISQTFGSTSRISKVASGIIGVKSTITVRRGQYLRWWFI